MTYSKNLILIVLVCLLGATGCNLIYKQNIQQGNAIEQDKLDQLKIGMTMNQVAYLLGTPAIRDPFHQSRWDYLYSYSVRGDEPMTRRVTLRFENAVLREMTGTDPENPEATVTAAASDVEPAADEIASRSPPTITPIHTPTERETGDMDPVTPAVETEESVGPEAEPAPGPEAEPEPTESTTVEPEVAPVAPEAAPDEPEVAPQVSEQQDVRPFADNPDTWLIQLGAFDSLQNARNLVNRLRNEGFTMFVYSQQVSGPATRYLVRSGGYESKAEAERQLQQIQQAFELDGFLVPPSG
ncbi:MAG TPA: outer membrane protein assembly factor BamE [Xanthomonadales bacterium]|nr:outer membrane protein assembly factor BamE [Xanthomonadales bacterium]